MPVKNIIPGQTVTKEKLQRDPLRPLSGAPPPNTTIQTLNHHAKYLVSYLGEDGWGRFRNEEVMKNLSAVVGKIRELVLKD